MLVGSGIGGPRSLDAVKAQADWPRAPAIVEY